MVDQPVFRVLFVCAANVCRSPGAAALLRARWAEPVAAAAIEIRSAGLRASDGIPACPTMSTLIGDLLSDGHVLDSHRSARLTADDLRWADVVLTAERAQRSEIISMDPSRRSTTFTMKEAARLSARWERTAVSSGAELVAQLNDVRGEMTPRAEPVGRRGRRSRQLPDHPDDILDSHVRADVPHRLTAKAVADAVDMFARAVPGRTAVS